MRIRNLGLAALAFVLLIGLGLAAFGDVMPEAPEIDGEIDEIQGTTLNTLVPTTTPQPLEGNEQPAGNSAAVTNPTATPSPTNTPSPTATKSPEPSPTQENPVQATNTPTQQASATPTQTLEPTMGFGGSGQATAQPTIGFGPVISSPEATIGFGQPQG